MSAKSHGQRVAILVIVAAFILSSLGLSGIVIWDMVNKKDQSQAPEDIQKQLEQLKQQQSLGGKVESTDLKVGTGKAAASGNKITVNYIGTLKDGTKFDSSYDSGRPFSFSLGAGEVIPGWDQGVVGMREGGKRKLIIPATLAYGDQSPSPKIPPNSDLIFEIELISVK